MSPQHWAQDTNDNLPNKRGTWCGTFDDSCELHWDQCKYKRTVPYDPRSNVPVMRSTPGFKTYRIYQAIDRYSDPDPLEETCICAAAKHTITEEEEQLINENFQDLFENTSISKQYNAEQDLLTENDRLQATTDIAELLR